MKLEKKKENEEFKDLIIDNNYIISNYGRIYSKISDIFLNESYTHDKGYFRIHINSANFLVHRLVFLTFKGTIPRGYEIHHVDNNSENNFVDNLQLINISEHRKISQPNYEKRARGSRHGMSKLNEDDVIEIRYLYYSQGLSSRKIAKMYGMDKSTILGVVKNESWRHVS